MSFNNHDQGDPNTIRYAKRTEKLKQVISKEDELAGEAINIYLKANNANLKDFIEWYKIEYIKL